MKRDEMMPTWLCVLIVVCKQRPFVFVIHVFMYVIKLDYIDYELICMYRVSNKSVHIFCLRPTAKLSAEGLESTFWTSSPPSRHHLKSVVGSLL
jgi:hypothetical protein